MVLDFKEIPQANLGSGLQDTFELFARDYFEILGYDILQQPDRGADGKKDLIIQEARVGVSGTSYVKWLVSCKHYAHSGKSVTDTNEPNITDRLHVHNCTGFIGFYSTLPSTSLGNNLEGLKSRFEIQSIDREKIEKTLLESDEGLKLASRYFPSSYSRYTIENPKPSKLFAEDSKIDCEYCHKSLLDPDDSMGGIMVMLKKMSTYDDSKKIYITHPTEKIYYSCKGNCDHILKNKYSQHQNYTDEWCDISDFLYPIGWIKKMMAWFNALQKNKNEINDEPFKKVRHLLINTFPFVSRQLTTTEKEKIKEYLENGLGDYL